MLAVLAQHRRFQAGALDRPARGCRGPLARLCSDLDPEPYMFDRLSCLDAGVRCGGWGQAFFKIYPVPRS